MEYLEIFDYRGWIFLKPITLLCWCISIEYYAYGNSFMFYKRREQYFTTILKKYCKLWNTYPNLVLKLKLIIICLLGLLISKTNKGKSREWMKLISCRPVFRWVVDWPKIFIWHYLHFGKEIFIVWKARKGPLKRIKKLTKHQPYYFTF